MKVGDLFIDRDGSIGVVVVVLESLKDMKGADRHACIGYLFESRDEIMVFKSEMYIIGDRSGAYILE